MGGGEVARISEKLEWWNVVISKGIRVVVAFKSWKNERYF
jgi:hypothetical protein